MKQDPIETRNPIQWSTTGETRPNIEYEMMNKCSCLLSPVTTRQQSVDCRRLKGWILQFIPLYNKPNIHYYHYYIGLGVLEHLLQYILAPSVTAVDETQMLVHLK